MGQNKDNCESNFCDGRAPGRASWPRVPPRASVLLTWHPGELRHATRIACHRARAQTTRQPSPAADARLSRTAKCLCTVHSSLRQCSDHSKVLGARTPVWAVRLALQNIESKPMAFCGACTSSDVCGPCGQCLEEQHRDAVCVDGGRVGGASWHGLIISSDRGPRTAKEAACGQRGGPRGVFFRIV